MTYHEFWPRYLKAHSRPATRLLHYAGSVLAVSALLAAAITRDWRWCIAAPVIGYAFAWSAHLGIEGNRPATFGHPIWSLASDVRMLGLWLTGRLHEHLADQGSAPRPATEP